MKYSFFNDNSTEDIIKEMETVYLNDNRPWIVGYSGGKDSSLVTQLMFKMLTRLPKEKRHKKVYIISSDTLIENPIILKFLESNIKKINQKAKEEELPIEANIVYPDYEDSFWTNIIGKGYPPPKSIQYRWCTERLKIKPTNKFIIKKLKTEDIIVLLGVRKEESQVRKSRIEKREIDGYLLTPHNTLKNEDHAAYVYSPIVELTTDDVWETLLNYFKTESPWGTDNGELFKLYAKGSGDGECPFIVGEKNNSTCGNSRFGCWTCTVVSEDKSLKGFIETGYTWLIPLAKLRDWLKSDEFRNNPKYRKKHRRNGSVTKREDGSYLFGPFNFEGRKLILERLLKTENEINEDPLFKKQFKESISLIKEEELKAIDGIWDEEEDLTRQSMVNIYHKIKDEKLPWHDYKHPIIEKELLEELDKIIEKYEVNEELFKRLVIEVDKNKYYINKKKSTGNIEKLLNQQYVHEDIMDKIDDRS